MQWRKCLVGVKKCVVGIDYARIKIMILEKPTQAFGDATSKTSTINNLFIQHQNNTYFGALEFS